MVKKLSKKESEFIIPADDYSAFTLLDITDEFIHIIEQNCYFFPPDTVDQYYKLKQRYLEIIEIINKYTV